MIKLIDLEDDLKRMITYSPKVIDIMEFCKQFSGKERLINLYVQYYNTTRQAVTPQYFKDVISGLFVVYKIDKYLYVDFDQPIGV